MMEQAKWRNFLVAFTALSFALFLQAAAPLGRDTDRVLSELGIRC